MHTFVCGIPRTGKTNYAITLAIRQACPVLFLYPDWDADTTQYSKAVKVFPEFKPKQIIRALRRGEFVQFCPSAGDTAAYMELLILSGSLMKFDWKQTKAGKVIFLVDEVHKFAHQRNPKQRGMEELVKQGAKRGIHLIMTSQRPQEVQKSVVGECEQHIIFNCGIYGYSYFQSYKLPADDIKARLEKGGLYSFVHVDSRGISGPYKAQKVS